MYEFTEEDLKFNKRGSISPGQKEWLGMTGRGVRSFSWRNAFIAVGFMFLGLCIVVALYLQNEDSRAALVSNPMNLIVFPVTILAVTSILAFSIIFARRQALKLENSVLSSASGTIRLDQDSSGESGITSYHVFVGKKNFTFGDEMSTVFKAGKRYKVYYCKSGSMSLYCPWSR